MPVFAFFTPGLSGGGLAGLTESFYDSIELATIGMRNRDYTRLL